MSKEKSIVNSDAPYLMAIFRKYGEVTGKPWFSFKVSQISTALEPLVKAIEAAKRPTERELALEKEKDDLLKKYALKGPDGKHVTQLRNLPDGTQIMHYQLGDKTEAYNAAFIEMVNDKFPDVQELSEERRKGYEELLTSITVINVDSIKMSEVPENLITGNEMMLLFKYGLLYWDIKKEDK